MSLEEIKEQYAKEEGYKGYDDFMWCISHGFSNRHHAINLLEKFNSEASFRYAKAKLEEAAEEIKNIARAAFSFHKRNDLNDEELELEFEEWLSKQSITETPLD